jgi:hypothetical protein
MQKRSLFRSLLSCSRATAAIEFAIILPLLLMMVLPLYDYFRFIMYVQKINKTATSIADMIVMSDPAPPGTALLTDAALRNIHSTANFLMQPFDFSQPGEQRVRTTSVYNPPGAQGPGIYWGYEYDGVEGARSLICNSSATAHQGACSLENQNPGDFEGRFYNGMQDGENAIVVRVCSDFRPMFNWIAILPIIEEVPPSPEIWQGQDCATDKLSFVRFFPARNGPLLQIR